MMSHAVIYSGAGRYADPWHPFAETTQRLAKLARDAGWTVTVCDDIDQALRDGLDGFELLIVNAGDPWHHPDQAQPLPGTEAGNANLARAFERGISVLGMHCAAASLRDYPQFRRALGGEWVPNQSWHPERGDIHVRCLHDQISEGLCDFTVNDERYTDLVTDAAIEPLLTTTDEEGNDVTVAWARQYGDSRVVYDSLGHDGSSYDSCGHKSFLRRALTWLAPQATLKPRDEAPDRKRRWF